LFSPRITREQVSRSVLGDIVNRVFDGSAKAVLLGVFEQNDIDRGELKELRKLIDQRIKGTDK
jgi:predicted transcriptional regulator